MDLKKIYEDEFFLAINKPPGFPSDPQLFSGFYPVHRLDKETSGVLLLAKTPMALGMFQDLFRKREIKKAYLGLFYGIIMRGVSTMKMIPGGGVVCRTGKRSGFINGDIKRLPRAFGKFGIIEGGRTSQTAFKVLRYFRYRSQDFSLAEIYPLTGRTHQIRVHFSNLGWPLVGDKIYRPARLGRDEILHRQFLHAKSVSFRHPLTDGALRIEAALPEDLRVFLKVLERYEVSID